MTTLDEEIAAFNEMRPELEAKHRGEWVVICGKVLAGTFHSFQQAANVAIKKYGRGPYLIRQVGVASIPMPVSVLYALPHDRG